MNDHSGTNSNANGSGNLSDLDWLAFQYIADELSDAQHAEFEARLADDPAACEAVAQAMEMAQLVYQTQPASEPVGLAGNGSAAASANRSTSATGLSGWFPLAALAAMLAIAFLGSWWLRGSDSPDGFQELDTRAVALVWADEGDKSEEVDEELDELLVWDESDFELDQEAEDESETWLMLALSNIHQSQETIE